MRQLTTLALTTTPGSTCTYPGDTPPPGPAPEKPPAAGYQHTMASMDSSASPALPAQKIQVFCPETGVTLVTMYENWPIFYHKDAGIKHYSTGQAPIVHGEKFDWREFLAQDFLAASVQASTDVTWVTMGLTEAPPNP